MNARESSSSSPSQVNGARSGERRFALKSAFVALSLAGIWIGALCTVPQLLGNYLWRWLGIATDLPLRHLLQVSLNAIAVFSFILLTRKSALLVPRWPRRPLFILVFLPLVTVNLARGPLLEFNAAFYLVTLASKLLTGFWEEFLFRGLIQSRLSVLGNRASLVTTALLFSSIHWYGGILKGCITFAIGLAFSVARNRIGLWPLVVIHCLIDFTSSVFQRQWDSFHVLALSVVGAYLLLSIALLVRTPGNEEQAGD